MRELIEQLKALKHSEVRPREEWLKNSRSLLLSQIKNTVEPEAKHSYKIDNVWTGLSIFLPKSFVYSIVRPVAVLLVVMMVATSGWVTTVDAAYNTLPGDWLYPAKRAAEKTQVAVATAVGAKTTETKLHTEFAKRRATEAKQIVKSNDPKKNEKVAQVVNDLKKEIQNVNNNLSAEQNGAMSASVIKEVKQDIEQINNVLQEVKTNSLASPSTTVATATTQAVSDVKNLVQDAGVKATEVLVNKQMNGDTTVSSDEVKKEISNTLDAVVTSVGNNKQSIDAANVVMEAAQAGVQKESSASGATASAKALSDRIDVVVAETKVAAEQTQAAKVVADQKISEAKDLLDKGDLVSAVDKMKEAAAATDVAEKLSDKTLSNAHAVLPVATVIKEVAPILSTGTNAVLQVIVTTTPTTGASAVVQVIMTTTPKATDSATSAKTTANTTPAKTGN
ncbi:MAG: hypothetical protein A2538_04600 [Candidatus Magasanikbacteria bacterium RIFOXYD2_FULL_41_14]|uniref:DUF5667 domain-containing protein n=1 Tax=Candidatus Magasanikbacteria bacterium RIFOXYD2_FULL_41_14 TaxID=1798709 RepID=A0A1F6PFK8_9BACT|nr:MAG: hypothetical protein A2538_04600 [Candidatus Magasanikbacteria bacterium RIFOXYD2_FULL_41_14]